jgi:hypothetical protein
MTVEHESSDAGIVRDAVVGAGRQRALAGWVDRVAPVVLREAGPRLDESRVVTLDRHRLLSIHQRDPPHRAERGAA